MTVVPPSIAGPDANTHTSPTTARWRWSVSRGLDESPDLRRAWNDLAHRGTLSPTGDATWTYANCHAFGPSDDGLAVHLLYNGDHLVCALSLQRRGAFLRRWTSVLFFDHAPYWTFAMDETAPHVAARVVEHLLESADVLDFEGLHETGPLYLSLTNAARQSGFPSVTTDWNGDALIDLRGPWERFFQSLSKNIRTDTPRHRRSLEKRGTLSFETLSGDSETFEAVLEECFDLETLGWKGQQGSPIKADSATHLFYTALARGETKYVRMALYTLRFGSRLIAFEYCIRGQKKINMLKLSYDPEFAKYSPGSILRLYILEKELREGDIETYHLGFPSEWKLRWATRVERLVGLRIYSRRPVGIAAYLGPKLRSTLKKVPALRAAVKFLRSMRRTS